MEFAYYSAPFTARNQTAAMELCSRSLSDLAVRRSPRSMSDRLLRSIACVNADIVKRQIGRPHMGPVTTLPKPDGDRNSFW